MSASPAQVALPFYSWALQISAQPPQAQAGVCHATTARHATLYVEIFQTDHLDWGPLPSFPRVSGQEDDEALAGWRVEDLGRLRHCGHSRRIL